MYVVQALVMIKYLQEVWRKVPKDFIPKATGEYEVSNFGRIRLAKDSRRKGSKYKKRLCS